MVIVCENGDAEAVEKKAGLWKPIYNYHQSVETHRLEGHANLGRRRRIAQTKE
jgi:hypothetical protein